MFEIDDLIIIYKESNLLTLGFKESSYTNYGMSLFSWNLCLFGLMSSYYVSLMVYGVLTYTNINTDLQIQSLMQPVVTEVIANKAAIIQPFDIDVFAINAIFVKYKQIAHNLMVENNNRILVLSYEAIISVEEITKQMSKTEARFNISVDTISSIFKDTLIIAIKNDEELYNNLLKNDYIVDYIARMAQKGFNDQNILKALGFPDLEF